MKFVLQPKLKQNIKITASLRQSIELLQYTNLEIYDFIKEQEMENPILELEESYNIQSDYKNLKNSSGNLELNDVKSAHTSPREQLLSEVRLNFECHYEIKLLQFIINNLDNYGYLQKDIHLECHCFYHAVEIEKGVELLRGMGYPGIGSASVKAFLISQISNNDPNYIVKIEIINHYLKELSEYKYKEISLKINLLPKELQIVHEEIKRLEPYPYSLTDKIYINYVIPDVIVERERDHLTFQINDHFLPEIKVKFEYVNLVQINSDTSKYIKSKLSDYQWLVNSLEQRRNTLMRIMQVLLKKQYEFFIMGHQYIAPLTLKEVADGIGVHESTVSRAIMNKFIQTPVGTFDFKILFSSKIEMINGTSISQMKVKKLLEKLILEENKSLPFSDQQICNYFNENLDIPISRRTINKYRKELKIPSASKRKFMSS